MNKRLIMSLTTAALVATLCFTSCQVQESNSTETQNAVDTATDTSTAANNTTDTADITTTDEGKSDVTPLEIGTIDKDSGLVIAKDMQLSETDMKSLYDSAVAAANNNNFQYAYGLFSRLAVEGYSDSSEKAAELRAKAYATPVITVSAYVFENFTDSDIVDSNGILYSDENGTPRFIYAANEGGKTVARTFTPDPALTGVISFNKMSAYYNTLCLCLKSDGTFNVFYDPDQLDKIGMEECTKDSGVCYHCLSIDYKDNVADFVKAVKAQTKAVRCVDGYEGELLSCAVLHADGTVDYYSKGALSNAAVGSLAGETAKVTDLYYPQGWGPYGTTASGKTFGNTYDYEYIATKNLTEVHAMSDFFVLNDGRAYYVSKNEKAWRDFMGYKEDAVFAVTLDVTDYLFFSSKGEIYNVNDEKTADAKDVSYLYKCTTGETFTIGNDGKVASVKIQDSEQTQAYNILLDKLSTVTVITK